MLSAIVDFVVDDSVCGLVVCVCVMLAGMRRDELGIGRPVECEHVTSFASIPVSDFTLSKCIPFTSSLWSYMDVGRR